MITPTLTTRRLTLRPLTKATQRQIDWLRDPEVVRYSEQRHRDHTLSSQLKYIDSFTGGYIWGIHEVVTGAHFGNLTATVDTPNSVADVGIMLGTYSAWRHGFGTEAWQAATNWLLEARDGGKLRKLEAGCAATNLGMKRILEKTGFILEGERRNKFVIDHAIVGALLYGRFK